MKIEISETTLKHILSRYPHLGESSVKLMFICGKIKSDPKEPLYPDFGRINFLKNPCYTLCVSEVFSEMFNVYRETELIAGEDGIILTIYEE